MRVWGTLIVAYVISVGMSVPIPFARWGSEWMHAMWWSRAEAAACVAALLLFGFAPLLVPALRQIGPHLLLLPLTRKQRFAIDVAALAIFYFPPLLIMLVMTLGGRDTQPPTTALPIAETLRNISGVLLLSLPLPALATMLAARSAASARIAAFASYATAMACAFAPSIVAIPATLAFVALTLALAARAFAAAPDEERITRVATPDHDQATQTRPSGAIGSQPVEPLTHDVDSQPPTNNVGSHVVVHDQITRAASQHNPSELLPQATPQSARDTSSALFALLRNELRWLLRFGAVLSSTALFAAMLVGAAQLAIRNNDVLQPLARARVAALFGALAAAALAGNIAAARRMARPFRAFEATLPVSSRAALHHVLIASSPILLPALATFFLFARDGVVLLIAIPYAIAVFVLSVLLAESVVFAGTRGTGSVTMAAGCAAALIVALEPRVALLIVTITLPFAFRAAMQARASNDMPAVPAEVAP